MTVTAKYEFETLSYGTVGWNALLTTLMNQLETFLPTRTLGTLGETVVAYEALYVNAADDQYYKAKADGAHWPCIAIAVEGGERWGRYRLHRHGIITNVAWTWTPGGLIYLSAATAGELTQVDPGVGARQIVGIADTATTIFFTPYLGDVNWKNTTVVDVPVKEENTSAIIIGQPVYVSGAADASTLKIGLAQGTVAAKTQCIGIAAEAISQNATGTVRYHGLLTGIDATKGNAVNPNSEDWAAGDELWVASTAGGLTNVQPTSGTRISVGFAMEVESADMSIFIRIRIESLDLEAVSITTETVEFKTGLADAEYSGIVEDGTAGAALSFGELVYLAVADSRWEKTKADAVATSAGKLGMCVLAAASDGDPTKILLWGNIRADSQFPSLTVGAQTFIDAATAGVITNTAPSGTENFVVRVIGFGNTADELFFCPSPDYYTLSGS